MGDTVVAILGSWFEVRLEASKKIKIFFDICDIHVLKYGCSISKGLYRDLLRELYKMGSFCWVVLCAVQFFQMYPIMRSLVLNLNLNVSETSEMRAGAARINVN